MSTEQIPPKGSAQLNAQLDRIEAGIGDIRERLSHMEARQDSHGAEMEAQKRVNQDVDRRLRSLEVTQARNETTEAKNASQSEGRWGAVGSVGLVVLGSSLTFAGYFVLSLMTGGN